MEKDDFQLIKAVLRTYRVHGTNLIKAVVYDYKTGISAWEIDEKEETAIENAKTIFIDQNQNLIKESKIEIKINL